MWVLFESVDDYLDGKAIPRVADRGHVEVKDTHLRRFEDGMVGSGQGIGELSTPFMPTLPGATQVLTEHARDVPSNQTLAHTA